MDERMIPRRKDAAMRHDWTDVKLFVFAVLAILILVLTMQLLGRG